MQVWLALWAGYFDESLVKLWSPLMLAAAAGSLYVFARGAMGRAVSLALVAVFLGAPLLSYHSIEAYSDLLVGTNLFCALFSFVRVMQGRRSSLPLVGAFAALALFSKNEAPGFVLPLMLSAGLWLWSERERQPRVSALFRLTAPLALVLPWFLFKFAHSLSLTQDRHALEPAYQAGVADYIFGQLLTLQNFNIILVALPVLLVINGRPSKMLLHALFPPAFFTLFFVVLYMLIEYYHSTLLMGTIFYRNVLTYYPSLALVTAMVLGELLAKTAAPEPDPAARKTKHRR
jgi:4-amino-4-deoxy-L-arabinose transferase-like glycosyltransferase